MNFKQAMHSWLAGYKIEQCAKAGWGKDQWLSYDPGEDMDDTYTFRLKTRQPRYKVLFRKNNVMRISEDYYSSKSEFEMNNTGTFFQLLETLQNEP